MTKTQQKNGVFCAFISHSKFIRAAWTCWHLRHNKNILGLVVLWQKRKRQNEITQQSTISVWFDDLLLWTTTVIQNRSGVRFYDADVNLVSTQFFSSLFIWVMKRNHLLWKKQTNRHKVNLFRRRRFLRLCHFYFVRFNSDERKNEKKREEFTYKSNNERFECERLFE